MTFYLGRINPPMNLSRWNYHRERENQPANGTTLAELINDSLYLGIGTTNVIENTRSNLASQRNDLGRANQRLDASRRWNDFQPRRSLKITNLQNFSFSTEADHLGTKAGGQL
jgi:hypothetical protein